MLADTYKPIMTISTVGSEYWKTAPVGHLNVIKNTKISIGIDHTIKLFRYHALACNQLSSPMSIIASWKIYVDKAFLQEYINNDLKINIFEKLKIVQESIHCFMLKFKFRF